jgi:crotonobetainyl-CoA:carnitine CoA-transferase CaiB-like acyl-CoA transferase
VLNVAEVFDDPQIRHQRMRITIDDPKHGPLDVLGFPIKFADAPCRVHLPPPDLGEHTDAVLAEVGYTREAIGELRRGRVI